jgi:phospholysine phosphohistidine inorganic pyrophosphate phosphatase
MPPEPIAFLFDLDGTVYVGDRPVPGAAETLARLRRTGTAYRFVTNTTSRSRAMLAQRLRGFGIDASSDEIHTPLVAAGIVLAERRCRVVAPFSPTPSLPDLGSVTLRGGVSGRPATTIPDAVLVGDLGERWSYGLMQEAFEYLLQGAALIALSRDRYFRRDDGLALDAGAFVTGLEYAAGRDAVVVGKPSAAFFLAAAAALGVPAGVVAVVGDDLWSDVRGAQQAGLAGWLVRTGKFDADALADSGINPDRILDSIADIAPALRYPT